jgi:hypothetical protein
LVFNDCRYPELTLAVRQVVADFEVESPNSTIRKRQVKAARVLGLTLNRLLGWWHGRVRYVELEEGEELRRRIAIWRQRRADLDAAQTQLDTARARFDSEASRLVARLAPPRDRPAPPRSRRAAK